MKLSTVLYLAYVYVRSFAITIGPEHHMEKFGDAASPATHHCQ